VNFDIFETLFSEDCTTSAIRYSFNSFNRLSEVFYCACFVYWSMAIFLFLLLLPALI